MVMRRWLPLLALMAGLLAGPASASVPVVVDPQGEPVVDAEVRVLAHPAVESPVAAITQRLLDGRTDGGGRFPGGVPDLDALLVVVDHPDHGPFVHQGPGLAQRIVLPAGEILKGRVEVMEGQGPAGAETDPGAADPGLAPLQLEQGEVCARWATRFTAWRWTRSWQRCVGLDGDGGFLLSALPGEPVEIEARVPGFLPSKIEVSLPVPLPRQERSGSGSPSGPPPGQLPPEVVLVLERGVLVAGRVTDLRQHSLPDVHLVAGLSTASSGPDGRFVLAVPTLPVRLEATADGYRSTAVDLERKEDLEGLVLALAPGQQIQGLLLGNDGEALEQGELVAELQSRSGGWTLDRHDLTLDEGLFRVDLPEAGRYRFALASPGHRVQRLPEMEVTAGESVDLGTRVLQAGAGVLGRLVDATSGEPLREALVRLVPLGHAFVDALRRGDLARGVSGEDGRFRVTGLAAGEYELRIRVGRRAELVRELGLAEDEQVDLGDLSLGPGVALSGIVRDRRGEGRPGLRVELLSPSGTGAEPIAVSRTGEAGRFGGLAVQPGVYRLQVLGERPLLSQDLVLEPGEGEREVELVLAAVRLRGVVLRAGEPVEGGFLILSSDLDPGWRRGAVLVQTGGALDPGGVASGAPSTLASTEVGRDGRFELEDVPAGPVTAEFHDLEGDRHVERLTVPDRGDAGVVIELDGQPLAGVVADAATGAPLQARLRLLDLAGRQVVAAASAADGTFVLENLEAQDYRLEVAAEEYRSQIVEPVTPGRDVQVELEAGTGGRLTVRLSRPDGSVAGSVLVTLLTEAGHPVRSLITDAYGVRRFPDLPAGRYHVVWSDPLTGTGSHGPVVVGGGEEARVDEILETGGDVVLSCGADCGGSSLKGLSLFTVEGVEIGAYLPSVGPVLRFSADGLLPLGRLAPGGYLLRVWVWSGPGDHVLEIAGGNTRVVLDLPPPGPSQAL